MRNKSSKSTKSGFQNNVAEAVTVYCDGKLLRSLNVTGSREESLPILVSFRGKEQHLAVTKLGNSTSKSQAVSYALFDWTSTARYILCIAIRRPLTQVT